MWSLALCTVVPDWPNFDPGHQPDCHDVVGFVLGQSTVWYLWAIVLCLVYARLTAALPGWAAIALAVSGYVAIEAIGQIPGHLPALARSLPGPAKCGD